MGHEEPLFDEIKRYVGFNERDVAALVALGPRVDSRVDDMVDEFYRHILEHPDARRSITGGDAQVERLKGTLRLWIRGLFVPPFDDAYYHRRARIGRRHVEINLPQQYMLTAVNVVRLQITDVAIETHHDLAQCRREVHAINKLLDMELAIMLHTYREDSLARLQRGERLATFGQLVASIAHELRNPLGVIDSSLFLLRKRVAPDNEPVVRHLDKIAGQVKLSNRIIQNLLDMVRDRPSNPRAVVVETLLAEAIESLGVPTGLTLDTAVPPELVVWADADQARQILVNLLNNAIEAAGPAGTVRVEARVDGADVKIRVSDSGPGIDPAVRGRLFEPLVTTKVRGIGLGLALCQRLAQRNHGVITLGSGALTGATFDLMLPAHRGEA